MKRACMDCPAVYSGGLICPECGAPAEPLPRPHLGPRTQAQKVEAFGRIEGQLRQAHRTGAAPEIIERLTRRYAMAWLTASYTRGDQ